MAYTVDECTDYIEYYLDGNLHRDDGLPAVEYSDGDREWWVHDKRHRDGGLPAIDCRGHREWWVNGEKHRGGDLPAVECPGGHKEYWVNGKRHRERDLPAFIDTVGHKEWWFDGIKIDEEKSLFFEKMKKKRVKRQYRKWYDLTYQVNKPAFYARMMRDMHELENDIGYKFDEPPAKRLKLY